MTAAPQAAGAAEAAERPLLVCLHDVTPAFARETRRMLDDLAPRVGRRLALGVVPDWHGAWPLAAHAGYCRLVQERAEDLLLHGYFHRRGRGRGPVSWLAAGSDEMNGLGAGETLSTLERGQRVFGHVFGEPARGFLAPAWQRGQVRPNGAASLGLSHVLGFFSLGSASGRRVPLATATWDCGRWRWLGHLGGGAGRLARALGAGVPTLALHPSDLARGFWPGILRQLDALLECGHRPTTTTRLLGAVGAGDLV